jgi:predicted component of type VI protein secretion system
LEILLKGKKVRVAHLSKAVMYIGREPGSDVRLAHADVSRRHARLIVKEGQFWIEDLQSTHGVFLNGRRAYSEPLKDGDRLLIAGFTMRYHKKPDEVMPFFDVGTTTDQNLKSAMPTLPRGAGQDTRPKSSSRRPAERHRALTRTEPHVIRSKPLPPKLMGLKHARNIVGSSDACHLREPAAGKPEAAVFVVRSDSTVVIKKLGMGARVAVDGHSVSERKLEDGDTIQIGAAEFIFRSGRGM